MAIINVNFVSHISNRDKYPIIETFLPLTSIIPLSHLTPELQIREEHKYEMDIKIFTRLRNT